MIKNYFTIAWRYLRRHKAFAFTNTFGLSLGFACAILIFTLVTWHLGFDGFHPHKDRIYRIVSEFHNETTEYQQGVPQPLGKAFRNDFAFAEKTARVLSLGSALVSLPGEKEIKKFQEEDLVAFAEPAFFDIFHFPLLEGDPATRLSTPNTAIITQKTAKKYFGGSEAIGKTIRIILPARPVNFIVTGILKDIPANTDRKEQVYLSYDNLKDYNARLAGDSSWGSVRSGMQCFVLLKPGVTKATVEAAFPTLVKKYYDADDAKTTQFKLQPLSDIHFDTNFDGYIDKKYLWALSCIGFFLILTACVNFINLSTAQALNRSREIGVRKVLGSLRSHLFLQFMAETALICFIAGMAGLGLAKLALPWLNDLLRSQLSIAPLQHWQLPVFLVGLMIAVLFLSGAYPGLILAKFRPVVALKGKLSQKDIGGFSLRRGLVVSQFAISQMLLIGMIVIAGQLHYSNTADLGFNKDAIVLLPVPVSDQVKMNTLRSEFTAIAGVENVSFSFEAPASEAQHFTDVQYDNRPKNEPWDTNLKDADDQYIRLYGLKLAAGRNFFPGDTARDILVNETFVKKLGLRSPNDVIGKKAVVGGFTGTIAGVVKDFHNGSLHNAIAPVAIIGNYKNFRNCSVKINLAQAKPTLAALNKIWNTTYPDYVYAYHFLDERIAGFYRLDNIMLQLVEGFAGIAILIGCLGLYALVSFMALKKTKEVGVRKVLGAGVHNILWLFGREFTLLLLLAFAIAAPIAWYAMHKWLQDFAYRIPISPWIFLLAMAGTFVIAALTVSYQSLKSAFANPVKSLRSE